MKALLLFLLPTIAFASSMQAGVSVVGALARTVAVKPGAPFDGVIVLKNNGDEPADVRVSQADYLFYADGTNTYGEPGRAPRSNARWLTLTPSLIRLAPGETQSVRYKGVAPADPKLRGTYWSMVMVEPNSAPAITPADEAGKVAVGLQTTIRFAVQIVTELGSPGTKSLKVLDKSIVQADGKRTLQLDIGNDGEQLLIPTMTVELFDAKGASVGRFPAGRSRIYPECSVRAKADLSNVPPGKYAAMVLLDSGDAQVMGAQYDLELAP
jgi:hypothetical protein